VNLGKAATLTVAGCCGFHFSLRIGLLLAGCGVNLAHARVEGVNLPSLPGHAFQKNKQSFFSGKKAQIGLNGCRAGPPGRVRLLRAALQKLNHESMDVASIGVADFVDARRFASDIKRRAQEIETEIYHAQKSFDGLAKRK
jgi:hypothetical protein